VAIASYKDNQVLEPEVRDFEARFSRRLLGHLQFQGGICEKGPERTQRKKMDCRAWLLLANHRATSAAQPVIG
jgi:hypothetical protein